MNNFLYTVSVFYKNEYVNPHVSTVKHILWQVRKLLNRFPYDISIHGIKIRIKDITIANGSGALINAMGFYDPNNMFFLEEIFRKKLFNSFFDIGANIGMYSLIVASTGHVRAFAFEPHPDTFSLLQENVNLNLFEQRISCFALALGDFDGEAKFMDYPGSCINRVVKEENSSNIIVVEMQKGQTVCQRIGITPNVLKIDVEGFEDAVLGGFGKNLGKVQVIFVECRSVDATSVILCNKYGFLGPYKIDYKTRSLTIRNCNYEDWVFINPQSQKMLIENAFLFSDE